MNKDEINNLSEKYVKESEKIKDEILLHFQKMEYPPLVTCPVLLSIVADIFLIIGMSEKNYNSILDETKEYFRISKEQIQKYENDC
jgi:hypothetical protein